jgi:hypothetical protein
MKKFISFAIATTLLLPAFAFALGPLSFNNPTPTTAPLCSSIQLSSATLGTMVTWASCTLIKLVVPFLFTLAMVGFIWGIITYYLNPTNEEKRKNGKTFMIWGIIALFVMISMWGLVGVLSNTFGIKTFLPQVSQ